jgi:hypothetical protein
MIFVVLFTNAAHASPLQDRLYDDYGIDLAGFIEVRQGWRLQNDPHQKGESISEGRLQVELGKDVAWAIFQFKGDMVWDRVEEEGRGEVRELNAAISPLDNMDIKIGRQTLTWGTGDLLFINDLFPKDWVSFFIGRDDEYLKAPSDALRIGLFSDIANLDFVWSPVFNGSTYIDGSRISYWNPILGRPAGRDFVFEDDERNRFFSDSDYALRLFKAFGSTETALYGYSGFWKTPEGLDPIAMKLYYPRLSVYGASVRSPLLGGIGNLEIGYYDSREDRNGDDPFVRNSEFRFLAGFEREVASDFTGGFQYYVERMSDYDEYEKSIGDAPKKVEFRHLLTVRLTKLLMNQNLRLSLFTYYSPSDQDAYIRTKVYYKMTDAWAVEVGGNIFLGTDDHSFFGQFQDNTNAYMSIRWHI